MTEKVQMWLKTILQTQKTETTPMHASSVFVVYLCRNPQYLSHNVYAVDFSILEDEFGFYNMILCLLFIGISYLNMDLVLQLSSVQPVRTIL